MPRRERARAERGDGARASGDASGDAPARGYWRAEEEQALKRAVRKHGIGAWERMRNNPEIRGAAVRRRRRDARETRNAARDVREGDVEGADVRVIVDALM